jgi:hypothetical protein
MTAPLLEESMGRVVEFEFPGTGVACEPEVAAALTAAYQMATDQLRRDGYTELVREIIANRIIVSAQQGERDPDRLCRSALAALGIRE